MLFDSLYNERFDHYTAVSKSDDAAAYLGIRTGYSVGENAALPEPRTDRKS